MIEKELDEEARVIKAVGDIDGTWDLFMIGTLKDAFNEIRRLRHPPLKEVGGRRI